MRLTCSHHRQQGQQFPQAPLSVLPGRNTTWVQVPERAQNKPACIPTTTEKYIAETAGVPSITQHPPLRNSPSHRLHVFPPLLNTTSQRLQGSLALALRFTLPRLHAFPPLLTTTLHSLQVSPPPIKSTLPRLHSFPPLVTATSYRIIHAFRHGACAAANAKIYIAQTACVCTTTEGYIAQTA